MSPQPDAETQATIARLLQENGISAGTRLYREVIRETLVNTQTAGVYRLAANAKPTESVLDVYGQGYVAQAEDMGAGLAFAESARPNWQETMELRTLRAREDQRREELSHHVEVEVSLGELLEQGGRIYPVESVTVERAWYVTLPQGFVNVREAT